MTDYTRLLDRLQPKPDGETPIRHRSAVVDAVNSDGTVDLDFDGTIVPDVPVLAGVSATSGAVVQVAVWRGALLVLGAVRDQTLLPVQDENGTVLAFTSTTFVAGSPACGVAFVAPPSGSVWVTWSGFLGIVTNPATNNQRRCELGWEIRAGSSIGSGTVIVAASSLDRIVAKGVGGNATGISEQGAFGDRYLVTGLTAGNAYNARTMHRVNGTNADGAINNRKIAVEPVV